MELLGHAMHANRGTRSVMRHARHASDAAEHAASVQDTMPARSASLLTMPQKQPIITSTDAYHGAHIAHARGISAILISKQSPFDLLDAEKLNDRYSAWSENISDEWQPISVGVISLKNDETT
ncbi:hypothetical protein BP6252_11166 [Coleophoma cylindrospora]|uniref:Uncharacterized protein n=1 Tax=Coleophoma cylindrospora TaxID=1849047 RepID=A0A3D8QPG8_9HELO|nr:hypothetical protein BP6252_11166 [Coleophoma cylindrospora]